MQIGFVNFYIGNTPVVSAQTLYDFECVADNLLRKYKVKQNVFILDL